MEKHHNFKESRQNWLPWNSFILGAELSTNLHSKVSMKEDNKGFSKWMCPASSLPQVDLHTVKWDFGHAKIQTQSYDALTCKSHKYASYMQNHMCGNRNINLPKYLYQCASKAHSFWKKLEWSCLTIFSVYSTDPKHIIHLWRYYGKDTERFAYTILLQCLFQPELSIQVRTS